MTPTEYAIEILKSLQDEYGNVHVPPSEVIKALPSDLLRAIADERIMVRSR
jgi:hypothetical protein